MAGPVSPLAPAAFPALPEIAGVRFASVAAGVRYANRTDVMLAELEPGSAVAGVFTRSSTRSAPVRDCEAKIGADTSRAAFPAIPTPLPVRRANARWPKSAPPWRRPPASTPRASSPPRPA